MYRAFKELPPWLRLAIIFPLFFLNGFLLVILFRYFYDLLNYLIVANLLAFLLGLGINTLMSRGVKKGLAIAIILFLTVLIVIIITAIIVPLIITQLTDLLNKAPEWVDLTQENLKKLSQSPILEKLPLDFKESISQITNNFYSRLEGIASQALNILIGTLDNVLNSLIVIVLTIFILLGGDEFWQGILSWLPTPWNTKIVDYTSQTFKDYFFVRLILAAIYCVSCTLSLWVLRVPFAFLFSLILSLCSFIPIVGGIIGLFITIFVFFYGISAGIKFLIVTTLINQIMDNVIGPKMMGASIGLNPIWLIISLFVGGQIAGILGLILAVPVASVIKRIIDDLRSNSTVTHTEQIEDSLESEKLPSND